MADTPLRRLAHLTADGVWSIYLTPEGGARLLDGEDTDLMRARDLYALAVAEAPATTHVELVTPSGRVARSSAGKKPTPEPLSDCVVAFALPEWKGTPLAEVARKLSSAGWRIRADAIGQWRVYEDTKNLLGHPHIEMDYDGDPHGLIAAVDRLDQELTRLACVGWTAEARYERGRVLARRRDHASSRVAISDYDPFPPLPPSQPRREVLKTYWTMRGEGHVAEALLFRTVLGFEIEIRSDGEMQRTQVYRVSGAADRDAFATMERLQARGWKLTKETPCQKK